MNKVFATAFAMLYSIKNKLLFLLIFDLITTIILSFLQISTGGAFWWCKEMADCAFLTAIGMKMFENSCAIRRNYYIKGISELFSLIFSISIIGIAETVLCVIERNVGAYKLGILGHSSCFSEILRRFVSTQLHEETIPEEILDTIFCFIAFLCLGYLLAALRQRIGSGKLALIMFGLMLILEVMGGMTLLGKININIFMVLPSIMYSNILLATIWRFLLSGVFILIGLAEKKKGEQ